MYILHRAIRKTLTQTPRLRSDEGSRRGASRLQDLRETMGTVEIVAALIGAAGVVAGVTLAEWLRRRHGNTEEIRSLAWSLQSQASLALAHLHAGNLYPGWETEHLAVQADIVKLRLLCSRRPRRVYQDATEALAVLSLQWVAVLQRYADESFTDADQEALDASFDKVFALTPGDLSPYSDSSHSLVEYLATEGLGAPLPPPLRKPEA